MRRFLIEVGVTFVATAAFAAQAQPAESGDPEPMETLFVKAPPVEKIGPIGETLHQLGRADIERIRPMSSADIARRLPSAHVTTNSRGETLVYLRNATERQTSVFFDGALLNVPWDNRYDLGLLPAGVIGGAASASGALSPQYGVNALGAVDFTSPRAGDPGVSVRGFGGTQEKFGGGAAAEGSIGAVSLLAAGGGYHSAGDRVADHSGLAFHQDANGLRSNTDVAAQNAFLRASAPIGAAEVSAAFLYADADRGIAPESDRADARFWRYPDARTIMGILKGEAPVGGRSALTTSLWTQAFNQTIGSYGDDIYAIVANRQEDSDRTYGARAILQSNFGSTLLTTSANILHSRHAQRDTAFAAGAPPATSPERLFYTQDAASLGVDLEHFLTDDVTVAVGVGVDRLDYGKTGPLPSLDSFTAPVARAAIAWAPNDAVRLRAAMGRKSRMPTMRELFGVAINRFLINPDLKPETVNSAEFAIDYHSADARLTIVAFGQQVRDTIDQRNVGSLRQRVNLPGSFVVGGEVSGEIDVTPALRIGGDLMLTHARRRPNAALPREVALERPSLLASVRGNYEFPNGLAVAAEVERVGRAYSLDGNGDPTPLARSTQLNASASYALLEREGDLHAEVFVRGDNVTDSYIEPQAGLPAAGRSVIAGVELTW